MPPNQFRVALCDGRLAIHAALIAVLATPWSLPCVEAHR